MTAVDMSKIKPGDKVMVEMTVIQVTPSGVWDFYCAREEGRCGGFNLVEVRSHTPAPPPPIKVGDEIPSAVLGCRGKSYTVIGIDGGYVWFGGQLVVELEVILSIMAVRR